ncbi:MAG: hypothetical protein K6F81_01945 [Acholeplasmatales bacterium]|nr:hypothetical protein [Acholeplasmatales bacterium]
MKIGKYSSIYALATQGIFSMIIFAAGGFCLGYFAIDSILWGVILAIVGLLVGLIGFIYNMLYILKKEEEEKKKNDSVKRE